MRIIPYEENIYPPRHSFEPIPLPDSSFFRILFNKEYLFMYSYYQVKTFLFSFDLLELIQTLNIAVISKLRFKSIETAFSSRCYVMLFQ